MELFAAPIRRSLVESCRRFHVQRLYLFGSATNARFNMDRSDLDFLVAFDEQRPGEYADNYLGLAEALEALLGRSVDLVTEPSISNPYFRESVFAERQLVYDKRDEEALV